MRKASLITLMFLHKGWTLKASLVIYVANDRVSARV